MTGDIVRSHYHGAGITLEQDQRGLFWGKALGKLFGPYQTKEQAEAYCQDYIDSMEG